MPGGHLTVAQLTAMLNTIPMEITFVDEDNINRFLNERPRISNVRAWRSTARYFPAIPKVEQQVRHIIGEFRKGTLDECADLDGEKRKNHAGYLYGGTGCHRHICRAMELVQDYRLLLQKSISFPT